MVETARRSQERLKRRIYRTPVPYIPGRRYYWIFGWTPLGKNVLWGPHSTTQEAELEAMALDTYEIFQLDTVNTARASREVKHELIARGVDPDEAMKRLIHKHVEATVEPKKTRYF